MDGPLGGAGAEDEAIYCPKCGAPDLQAGTPLGSSGTGQVKVRFDCPKCGLSNLWLWFVLDEARGEWFAWWDEEEIGEWQIS